MKRYSLKQTLNEKLSGEKEELKNQIAKKKQLMHMSVKKGHTRF